MWLKSMIKIYTLGNPLLKEDRLALEVAEELKKKFKGFEFVEFDPIESVEEDAYFMDVAKGIEDVKLVEEECFESSKIYSLHDFDLSQIIPLLKKAGKLKSFKLIAIPFGMEKEEAVEKVGRLLKTLSTLSSGSGLHS